ncbi:MAG: class I SAM-dependent methyltransferase [Chlamydiia bacterium]|nr:class I SAM-dependent methyltransferase [Chlamydiia bacterium]
MQLKKLLLSGLLSLNLHSSFSFSHEEIFSAIYKLGTWSEEGFSLSGSQIEITREYVIFLQDFLERNYIKTVVDLGCGDWAFSRYIDWTGIEYIGIDVVKEVIERNQRLFATPNITFIHGDAFEMELPQGDLLLCKDVFQHLSNLEIQQIIGQFSKYKHCLITNYVDLKTLSSKNTDIPTGLYRPIDLTKPPFNLSGEKVLNFFSGVAPKQTLYITPG